MRTEHRYPDPVLSQLTPQTLHHAHDRHLGGGIDPGPRASEESRDGGGGHDVPAFPVSQHAGQESLDAVDDPTDVDAQHPIPIVVTGHFRDPSRPIPALLHSTCTLPK